MGLNLMLKDYLIAIEEHRRECLEKLNILSAIAIQASKPCDSQSASFPLCQVVDIKIALISEFAARIFIPLGTFSYIRGTFFQTKK